MSRTHQPSYSSSDHRHQHQYRHPSTSSMLLNDPSSTNPDRPSTLHNTMSASTLNLQASEDFTLVAVDPSQSRSNLTNSRSVQPRLTDIPSPDAQPRPDTLSPVAIDRPRSTRQSSKRALTEALRLAQEAVLLDSQNEDPIAAFRAYSRSVTLLSEVMDRVIRGEHDTGRRSGRPQAELAREDEARRLKNIHDTYAERMRILAEMYEIQDELPPGVLEVEVQSDQPVIRPAPSSHATYVEHPEVPLNNDAASKAYTASSEDESSVPQTPTFSEQHFSSSDSLRNAYTVNPQPSSSRQISPSVVTSSNIPGNSQYSRTQVISSNPYNALRPRAASASARVALAPNDGRTFSKEPNCHNNSIRNNYDASEEYEPNPRVSTEPHQIVSAEHQLSGPSQATLYPSPMTPRSNSAMAHDGYVSPEATPRPVISSTFHAHQNVSYATSINGVQSSTRPGILVNATTVEGAISQRRSKSSLGVHAPPHDISKPPTPDVVSGPSSANPALSVKENRARAASQPGIRPPFVANYSVRTGSENGVQPHLVHQHPAGSYIPNTKAIHLSPLQIQLANSSSPAIPHRGSGHMSALPMSPLPPPSPQDPIRKPYHLMELIRRTMTSRTGGYITRRLHVPYEVWSQGGAKLANLPEKVRTIEVLSSALEELENASSEYCHIRITGGKLTSQAQPISRSDMEKWISKIEEWSLVCESVVGSVGRKLGVGEGFAIKKNKTMNSWSSKFARSLDKLTSSKSLESPASYVNGLIKLFDHAQLLDEHNKALALATLCYSAQPPDLRVILEARFKQSSEFFATVVLTFVIRDLSLLLDKYAKKGGQWLAE